jgi:hypothetical protein
MKVRNLAMLAWLDDIPLLFFINTEFR